jgi:hypothetical protein
MEHPLIGDISGLTPDELMTKINELNKKLGIAMRSGNGHLCNQLRMAIETYQTQYQARLNEQAAARGGSDFSDRISIE